jgi:quercetin dioxygenase-like cupin family protein
MTDRSESVDEDRLRTPPAERFAGQRHVFSLGSVLEELRAEDHPARSGHRQMALFRRGPVTKVLFSFEEGGRLEEHSAPGLVSIHVLDGRLDIAAGGQEHELEGGDVLVLDPNVPHDVRARQRSAMLLTVHLEKERAG